MDEYIRPSKVELIDREIVKLYAQLTNATSPKQARGIRQEIMRAHDARREAEVTHDAT